MSIAFKQNGWPTLPALAPARQCNECAGGWSCDAGSDLSCKYRSA